MNPAISESVSACQWYALRTRSRHEKSVRDRLHGNGFEPFLPLMKTLRQWSDRNVWTELPLFSGYCFARFALQARYDVLQIPGIIDIVGITGPQAIPADEMDALKTVANSPRVCDPYTYLAEGSWVEVVKGPLAGVRGQLVRKAGQHCIVIRVHLIQQAASVHIDVSEVVPLPPKTSITHVH
jgi:transcription termination/antitermination protein NusG